MFAIQYNTNDSKEFLGSTYYRVNAIYESNVKGKDDIELTEIQYNDWLGTDFSYAYINNQSFSIATAVFDNNQKDADGLQASIEDTLKELDFVNIRLQTYSDLSLDDSQLRIRKTELINLYKQLTS